MMTCPRSLRVSMIVAAFALIAAEKAAQACSLAAAKPLVLDPQSSDATPPETPTATLASIRRGKGPETSGCSQSSSSCDDLASIDIVVSAADDQAASDTLGFQLELTEGKLPGGFNLPSGPILATGGHLYLHWVDGATDDQEDISFTLAIRAVDPAGNRSPPTSVMVSHGGSGCSMVGGRIGSSWATTVGLLLLVMVGLQTLQRRTST